MAEQIPYRGYDIVPQAEDAGWGAWILFRGVPEGRVIGQRSGADAVAAAKREIDRRRGLRRE